MATEHGGSTILPRETGLIEAVVGGVLKRFGGDRREANEEGTPDTTGTDQGAGRAADRFLSPEEHIVDVLERHGGA